MMFIFDSIFSCIKLNTEQKIKKIYSEKEHALFLRNFLQHDCQFFPIENLSWRRKKRQEIKPIYSVTEVCDNELF